MRFLEDVLICKAELESELAAKHQKDKAEIQKLRAALQKRIDEVWKLTAGEESVVGLGWNTSKMWWVSWWVDSFASLIYYFKPLFLLHKKEL